MAKVGWKLPTRLAPPLSANLPVQFLNNKATKQQSLIDSGWPALFVSSFLGCSD
jgi:hypothetical protein